jgi:hypothetical protein
MESKSRHGLNSKYPGRLKLGFSGLSALYPPTRRCSKSLHGIYDSDSSLHHQQGNKALLVPPSSNRRDRTLASEPASPFAAIALREHCAPDEPP